jgi:uncharacterized glyoxalase superfamily protein PhnB
VAAKPIPDGFHGVTPHLVVQGAGKAIEFYTKAFGAHERFRMPGPDGKTIMHAEIQIGNSIVMLADEFPGMGNKSPKGLGGTPVTLHMYVPEVDAAFKRATSAGAEVIMPLSNMFWGDRYGIVSDPFGHCWSLATHIEDVPPQEMAKRAGQAMCG